jgi:hypothetical protein
MNPDLLLSVVTALSSFVLKTTLAFGVCLAICGLVEFSLRNSSVLALARKGCFPEWAPSSKHLPGIGSSTKFDRRRRADSRLVGIPAGIGSALDWDRIRFGPGLHAGDSYQEASAAEMDSGFHQSTAQGDCGRLSAFGEQVSRGAVKIAGIVGGDFAGNVWLD